VRGRLLVVREFDLICHEPGCGDGFACLPEKAFRDVEGLVRGYQACEDRDDALEFLRLGYRRNVGEVISVGSHVGLIQTRSGWQVEVLPKVNLGGDTGDVEGDTRRVFLQMLKSMKDFPGKTLGDARLKADRMPLYDTFISMYLREVAELVKRGVRCSYVTREDNLTYMTGKLIVAEHVRRNAAHGERFYVRHDEFLADRPENRLVKSTLLNLRATASSASNQREARQLLAHFEGVRPSTNYCKDFLRVATDRSMKDYDALMRWSRVFLLGESFTTFSGTSEARALLFPMERVFESFVARQLKAAVADLDWDVSAQDGGYHLFDSPSRFALRPDIVVTRNDGSRVVLDTKWKRLSDDPRKNYGISQADMYQMYAYAKKYGTPEVWLLYPSSDEMRDWTGITYSSDDGVCVRVFFVDVARAGESLTILRRLLMR
jgi:5-methylcytosine-specific restriction enzyme subunit McrC